MFFFHHLNKKESKPGEETDRERGREGESETQRIALGERTDAKCTDAKCTDALRTQQSTLFSMCNGRSRSCPYVEETAGARKRLRFNLKS